MQDAFYMNLILNGIEFIDRVFRLKLEMAKKKQKKLMQEFKNNG